jgi:hypothetical protein
VVNGLFLNGVKIPCDVAEMKGKYKVGPVEKFSILFRKARNWNIS